MIVSSRQKSVSKYFLALILLVSFCSNLLGAVIKHPGDTSIYQYSAGFDFIPGEESFELIADRLSCIENEIPLTLNTRVYSFINYFAVKDREYTQRVLEKTSVYFPLFEKYLEKYGLPEELKYLSIVESALEPRAISRAGAGGLWQFMPYTGRSYGLHQDFYVDQRFDPERATEAACKYLKMLYGMFGDWELALASYNSGPGNVRKAIRRSGYKKSFWEVYRYLPRETRSYLPQFVAITYIMNYGSEHNIFPENENYLMSTDTIMVDKFVNLQILAEQLNICYDDLEKVNPAIKRFALPDAIKKFPIQIPEDKIDFVRANRAEILSISGSEGKEHLSKLAKNTPGSTYGREKVVYRVKSGDVLGTIAQRYRVRVSDLRTWNNIRGNLIRVGQRLNIWLLPGRKSSVTSVASAASVTSSSTSNLTAKANPGPIDPTTIGSIHQVQPGDTLWDISRMYDGLTVDKIKKLNNLKSNRITPGQKLIVGS